MTKQRIATDGAPAALGAYSQAIDANGFVYCAGQLGLDPSTGQLAGGIAGADRAFDPEPGRRAGRRRSHARRRRQDDLLPGGHRRLRRLQRGVRAFFIDTPPARSTFAVKDLPRGGLVEIEAIAARPAV